MVNRWSMLVASCVIHMCIGMIYSWSVMSVEVGELTGWSSNMMTLCFSITILFLGMSASITGAALVRNERLPVALWVARVCWVLAAFLFIVSLYTSVSTLLMISCMLTGIATGIFYLIPVSMMLRWFPVNRGLSTGLVICSFGFGSLVASNLILYLEETLGAYDAFIIMLASYAVLVFISSFFLKYPNEIANKVRSTVPQYMIQDSRFRNLQLMFFCNIASGIALLGVLAGWYQELFDVDIKYAATFVGIVGIANAFGRIFWSWVGVRLGRPFIFTIFFSLQIIAWGLMSAYYNQIMFECLILMIISMYGGGFAIMPSLVSETFTPEYATQIYGRMLAIWGIAGVVGPLIVLAIQNTMEDYSLIGPAFGVILIIGLINSVSFRSKVA